MLITTEFENATFVVRHPVFNDFFFGKFSAAQGITVYKKNSPLFGVVFKLLPYSILFHPQNSF
jgi:hypothetical protein